MRRGFREYEPEISSGSIRGLDALAIGARLIALTWPHVPPHPSSPHCLPSQAGLHSTHCRRRRRLSIHCTACHRRTPPRGRRTCPRCRSVRLQSCRTRRPLPASSSIGSGCCFASTETQCPFSSQIFFSVVCTCRTRRHSRRAAPCPHCFSQSGSVRTSAYAGLARADQRRSTASPHSRGAAAGALIGAAGSTGGARSGGAHLVGALAAHWASVRHGEPGHDATGECRPSWASLFRRLTRRRGRSGEGGLGAHLHLDGDGLENMNAAARTVPPTPDAMMLHRYLPLNRGGFSVREIPNILRLRSRQPYTGSIAFLLSIKTLGSVGFRNKRFASLTLASRL